MLLALILFVIAIVGLGLKKSFQHMFIYESSERLPKNVSKVLKHLTFLKLLFSLVILAVIVWFSIIISSKLDHWLAFLVIFMTLSLVLVLLSTDRIGTVDGILARLAAAPLAYFVDRFSQPVNKLEKTLNKLINKFRYIEPMRREALLRLLHEQQELVREPARTDLELALKAISLNSEKVRNFMTPLNKTKTVSDNDSVGPIVLSELHASNRKIFPLTREGKVVGTVRLENLAELKSGGKAGNALSGPVIKLAENDAAVRVVKEFVKTNTELIFAENSSGKIVGVVYLSDVLNALAKAIEPIASVEY